jgi:hypothetical protein
MVLGQRKKVQTATSKWTHRLELGKRVHKPIDPIKKEDINKRRRNLALVRYNQKILYNLILSCFALLCFASTIRARADCGQKANMLIAWLIAWLAGRLAG